MAIGSLPPWLNVSPHDFVQATAAGATLGHAIADSTMRAWHEQAAMRQAAQEAAANRESHAQQVAVENAMNRLAADRLEAYRQSEIANRQKELGLHQQGLQMDQGREDIQQQRADEQVRRNTTLEGIRALAEKRQQEREDRIASTDKYMDIGGDLYRIPADGSGPVLVSKRDKNRPVTTKISAGEFGPELSGPVDSPEIANRLKQIKDKEDAAKNAPGILTRAYNYVTGHTTPTPTGSIPMNPVYPHPNDVAAPPPSTNEVIRVTKDGRQAVFDADTKQFLRYAQ